jgi:hypothetical protein
MAILGGILGYFECLFSVSKITHEELIPSGNLLHIAMENGLFIDGLPIKDGDLP